MDYLQEARIKLAGSRDSQEEYATEAALLAQQAQAAALIAICERLDRLVAQSQINGGADGEENIYSAPVPTMPRGVEDDLPF